MFCSKCGSKNNDGAKFCKECGQDLKGANVGAQVSNTQSDPNLVSSSEIKCGICGYVGPAKKGRNWFSQFLAIVCIILFWPITLIYFLSTNKFLCPKCSTNLVAVKNKNGVYMAQGRGWTPLTIFLVALVVIAIIGIMASVVLASLNTARDKGQDASVKSSLINVQAQAELYYDKHFTSYEGLCNDLQIKSTINNALVGRTLTAVCNDITASYAVTIPLNAGGYFCVDSYGNAVTTVSPLTNQNVCPKGIE